MTDNGNEGEGLEQPAPEGMQGVLGSRDVGDTGLEAERRRTGNKAGTEREQHGWGEARQRRENIAGDGLV